MTDATGDASETTRIEVRDAPNLSALLARAVATGPGRRATTLPDVTVARPRVSIDRDHVADYSEVCGFALGDALPATYLHLLAFPLSVKIMAGRDFPFALAGLVHVANRITRHRPVSLHETVDVAVHLADLRPHPKGRQFDVVASAAVADEVVWTSRSAYLKRGRSADDRPGEDAASLAAALDVTALPLTSVWRVPADIGRRYGAVSGDRNPIHLTSVTARPFGFSRAIAHGMWTKAHALAALEGRLPDAYTVDVAFKLPVLLPALVEYASYREGDDWHFALRSRSGKPHLAGLVTPS